ncbi:MAG: hypothetical protein GQ527_07760, partial [Bacteroidales bacterium]|nr:hypothetical protein [Bacteroidales bacterium]
MMTAKKIFTNGPLIFVTALIFLVVIFYYWSISLYIINIPHADEYGTVLNWLKRYINSTSFIDKFILLFGQANEHRILTCNVTTIFDYYLNGSVNFRRLLWIANFGLIIFFYLITLLFRNERRNPWVLFPVALLIFVPQHAISDWGVVGLASIFQNSLAIASMIFLSKKGKWNFAVAILLAFFTTFSFGNGMFIFISGYIILLLVKNKNYRQIIIWSLAMIVSVLLYFTDYNFSYGNGFSLYFLSHPFETLQFFFTFFGGIFQPFIKSNLIFYTISGAFIFMLFLSILIVKWTQTKKNAVALSIASFIILSIAASAVSRVEFGIVAATSPRYMLFQVLFLVILYFLFFDTIKKNRFTFVAILVLLSGVLFYGRYQLNFDQMNRHKNRLKEDMFYYHTDFKKINSSNPLVIKNTLDQSAAIGIYSPPSLQVLYPDIKLLKTTIQSNVFDDLVFKVESFDDFPNATSIKGWAFGKANNFVND